MTVPGVLEGGVGDTPGTRDETPPLALDTQDRHEYAWHGVGRAYKTVPPEFGGSTITIIIDKNNTIQSYLIGKCDGARLRHAIGRLQTDNPRSAPERKGLLTQRSARK